MDAHRENVRQLAMEHLAAGDPTGWFERLYQMAGGDAAAIPWADMRPNPHLVRWAERGEIQGKGASALVVGCGLGDDAEYLLRLGFQVTAFDVAATAIRWCRKRFGDSTVRYCAGDLFKLPASWERGSALVVEAYTLQVLPPDLQARAMRCIARCVAPGGTLLVVTRGRDEGEPHGDGLHWRPSRQELGVFVRSGLTEVGFEDFQDPSETPPVRRFFVEYRA